ncbi:MAG TPA: uracil permease [Methylomusa anaerophila]|uniref:Uracil permease n=1 Tax=Methylomusa anaerophila TaxID=1930071 RepID=A0A348ANL6_9FIRM|nr:uracil permease [Methylomusa anaerophila]BBB92664.1 uracil permease [Methylomusa anaerophila]HML87483.1 uracil permease [Methylomusa anaerophila]
MDNTKIRYDVEQKVALMEALPLSFQHLFAMFGATVLVPFLFKVNPATSLLMNGIGTLIYLTVCRGRIPAYLGSSFAFISPVFAILAIPSLGGYSAAQGGFIAFGLFFIVISQIIRIAGTDWLDIIFPPAAMGAIVAIIGLELAPVATEMAGLTGKMVEQLHIPYATAVTVSMFTLGVTILGSMLFRGFLAAIPVLIGVIAGYILSLFMGIVDITGIIKAPWFEVPTLYAPTLNIDAILMIFPAMLVVLAEHIGHLVVTGNIVDKDLLKEPGLHRSLLGDGISNMLSGLVGATPNTTYGENIGVMAITKVFSVWVIGGAAAIAILVSFVGKFAALIRSIPVPVMGGICILLFGVIAAAGIRMLIEKKVDYTKSRNLILTSVVLISGISGTAVKFGTVELKGMALGTIVAIIISIVFEIFTRIGVTNDRDNN